MYLIVFSISLVHNLFETAYTHTQRKRLLDHAHGHAHQTAQSVEKTIELVDAMQQQQITLRR